MTIILTTHYIEEAEEMADRIGVIQGGRLILVEDKEVLMRRLGKRQLRLQLSHRLTALPSTLATYPLELSADGMELTYSYDVASEHGGIGGLLRDLAASSIDFKGLQSRESSLEDIFVDLLRGQP